MGAHAPAGIASVVPFLHVHMPEADPAGVSWQLHVHHVTQNSVAVNSEVFAMSSSEVFIPRSWVVGNLRALLTATDVRCCIARGVSDTNNESLVSACEILEARVASVRMSVFAPPVLLGFALSSDIGVVHEQI